MLTKARVFVLGAMVAAVTCLHVEAQQSARALPLRAEPRTFNAIRSQAAPVSPSTSPSGISDSRAVLKRYCVGCHNERLKTAGLNLETMDVEHVADHAAAWEKVVQKLRTGAMPPAGRPRPDRATYAAVSSSLANALDIAATPNPGRTIARRLNRTEYANAIRDLLGMEVDGPALLPPDDADLGFDNMAESLSISPALLERYMFAARTITRLAVGDPSIKMAAVKHTSPRALYQDDRMDEDLPFGSRGGFAVRHYFPLDGEYDLKVDLRRQLYDYIRGLQRPQQLEVRVDNERVKVFAVGGAPGTPPPWSFAGANIMGRAWEDYTQHADEGLTVRFAAKAGPRVIGVFFAPARSERDGVLQPRAIGKVLAVHERWSSPSEAPEAAVDSVIITGPYNATGPGDTPSRRKIFECRPAGMAEEEPCAKKILSSVARRAFRRPVTSADQDALIGFYRTGRADGGFDEGVRRGVESIVLDPEFLFRIERDPAGVTAGAPYRVSDLELASRLSFFMWSSIPDEALLDAAIKGTLRKQSVLDHQVERMLADPRSKALVTDFASQWLSLRKLRSVGPTPELFVEFDDNLRQGFQQESELFIESQLREDRSVLDLLRADYTFVNERLARHYGIPNVIGNHFRRVTFSDGSRGGLLAQGSVLTLTSYANRTSPVLRGRWLLDNILGAPPPPPPPDVPALPERSESGAITSVRERLEQHRKNPACASCHAPMDPLGFALEGFDAIGKQRSTGEGGAPSDASGVAPDGARFEGLSGLKAIVFRDPEQFAATVTEKLLTYALGRGLEHYDMPVVRKIVREAAPHDYSWSSIIRGVVNSVPFQMRRSES
jgi:cytochrome c551/c552